MVHLTVTWIKVWCLHCKESINQEYQDDNSTRCIKERLWRKKWKSWAIPVKICYVITRGKQNELKMFAKKQWFSAATRCLILDTNFGGCENKQIGEMIVIWSPCVERAEKAFLRVFNGDIMSRVWWCFGVLNGIFNTIVHFPANGFYPQNHKMRSITSTLDKIPAEFEAKPNVYVRVSVLREM